ncbi:hypothetical protein HDE76_003332 [Rhodanobacter sp. ANJX3]|uniref:hypothetical protein n=1 Tax=Rhodanobacter sp. ANJX3 TaxID=2723083 RepID=UPI00160F38E0|nr:hypothetical protein [Rhodanobacter sp. ANJX3]MBB5360090.1 hypothetical protein [Rhodanobacter sp. ANJX3]
MAVSEAETMIATPDRPARHDRSIEINLRESPGETHPLKPVAVANGALRQRPTPFFAGLSIRSLAASTPRIHP